MLDIFFSVSKLVAMLDEPLAALVRAIAWELIQLGYRPADKPGYLVRPVKGPNKRVAKATWLAMQEILAGREP